MTASLPPLKTVFGFINGHGVDAYPAPLITIAQSEESYFAVSPNGAKIIN